MNEYQEHILVGIHTMLDTLLEFLMNYPPADATCATCRWFEDRPLSTHGGRCATNGKKYVGDDDEGNDYWFLPPTDRTDLCRHWRSK